MRFVASVLAALAASTLLASAGPAQITVAPAAQLPPSVKYVVCWARVGSTRFVSDPLIIEERDFEWMQNAFELAVLPDGRSFDDHACSSGASAAEAIGFVDQLRVRHPETAFNQTKWTGPFKIRGRLYAPPGSSQVTGKPAAKATTTATAAAKPVRKKAAGSNCKPSKSKASCVSPQ